MLLKGMDIERKLQRQGVDCFHKIASGLVTVHEDFFSKFKQFIAASDQFILFILSNKMNLLS